MTFFSSLLSVLRSWQACSRCRIRRPSRSLPLLAHRRFSSLGFGRDVRSRLHRGSHDPACRRLEEALGFAERAAMTFDQVLVLGVVFLAFVLFFTEWLRYDVVALVALLVLVVTGVVPREQSRGVWPPRGGRRRRDLGGQLRTVQLGGRGLDRQVAPAAGRSPHAPSGGRDRFGHRDIGLRQQRRRSRDSHARRDPDGEKGRAFSVLLLQGKEETLIELLSTLGCAPLAERRLRLSHPRRILFSVALFAAAVALTVWDLLAVETAFV